MTRYICDACGWIYDPEFGVPELEIDPGIPFEDLPDDFECPECGVGKVDFSPEEQQVTGDSRSSLWSRASEATELAQYIGRQV